jgi:hypothetical protein
MTAVSELNELRTTIATACRILAQQDLAADVLASCCGAAGYKIAGCCSPSRRTSAS